MAEQTALQMVNRVLKKARREVVSDVTGDLASAILDCVNDAAGEVLEMRAWPFLNRTDGIFTTVASFTGATASFTNLSATVSFPTADAPNGVQGDVIGTDKVSRIINTEDGTYGEQSFKILSGADAAGTFTGTIETTFPGSTLAAAADYRVFAAEYLLPTTVGDVNEVRIEQEDVVLQKIDEQWSFDRAVPAPHRDIGLPEVAMVGGKSIPSYDSSGSEPDERVRMILFPIADTAYVCRYSYAYRHARMTDKADTLAGVPEHIVTDIVDMAFTFADRSAILNNPTRGELNRRAVDSTIQRHSSRSERDNRPKPLPSLERRGGSRQNDVGRLPDNNFGSIAADSNSVLGGTRTTS